MNSPSISRITIRGYKSIRDEAVLDFRPLTILAGANSSGKSSAMQPLLLLKQTLTSPSDPGVMEIAGPNVRFNQYEQMFFQGPGSKPDGQTARISIASGTPELSFQIALNYRMQGPDLEIESQELSFPSQSPSKPAIVMRPGKMTAENINLFPEETGKWMEELKKQKVNPFLHVQEASRGFLPLRLAIDDPSKKRSFIPLFTLGDDIGPNLLKLIHVPGLRGNPERSYLLRKPTGPRFDGLFQDYVAGIVAGWNNNNPRSKRLGRAMRQLDLTWKVTTRDLDATSVEVLVGRLREARRGGARDLVNIADVGFGVSQVLPALVALEVAVPGQMVYLEQPEIHLHPRAQRALATILAQAAKRGVRVVVETHSSLLLRGIQTLVAKEELDPALVKLHWFTRDHATGATRVDSSDLDEKGSFDTDWPADFDDTHLASEGAYLDAVEARFSRE